VVVDNGSGENTQEVYNLKSKQTIIGRGEDGVDLKIDHQSVSTKHATIEPFDEIWTIKDGVLSGKKSSNGTFLNGKKIQSGVLKELDEIRFGKGAFFFSFFVIGCVAIVCAFPSPPPTLSLSLVFLLKFASYFSFL
jgi:pSer/pThr/pTyr-binding forkhead associated (FHA) protein